MSLNWAFYDSSLLRYLGSKLTFYFSQKKPMNNILSTKYTLLYFDFDKEDALKFGLVKIKDSFISDIAPGTFSADLRYL